MTAMRVVEAGRDRAVVVGAALLAAGFIVLAFAWVGANPPGASPDENAHVVKAYATGEGDMDGQPYDADLSGVDSRSAAWFREVGRSYPVPAAVVPPQSIRCFAFDRNLTADCQHFDDSVDQGGDVLAATHFGTYSPALYVPIGLAMRDSRDYQTAEWRGRLMVVALCAIFVSWSALLLSRRGTGWLPLAGLAMAMTPLVVFASASVTTSGIEITSAICLWSALLRITRQPGSSRGAPWVAAAVSGGVMALSRPVDAVLIAVVVLTIAVLAGWGTFRSVIASSRRPALVLGGVLVGTAGLSALWSIFVTPHPPLDLGVAARSLGEIVRDLPNQVRQAIGIFGWNDTPMPQATYVVVLLVLAALLVVALRVAARRERLALGGLALAILTIHLGLGALVEAQIGFGMQARYVLPLVVGVPLIAADLIETHRAALSPRLIRFGTIVMFVTAAAVQSIAFTANVHRYAVGANSGWIVPWDSRWAPDGGFTRWFSLAAIGVVLMLTPAIAMILGGRTGPGQRDLQRVSS